MTEELQLLMRSSITGINPHRRKSARGDKRVDVLLLYRRGSRTQKRAVRGTASVHPA